jgi:hypothetical protein
MEHVNVNSVVEELDQVLIELNVNLVLMVRIQLVMEYVFHVLDQLYQEVLEQHHVSHVLVDLNQEQQQECVILVSLDNIH